MTENNPEIVSITYTAMGRLLWLMQEDDDFNLSTNQFAVLSVFAAYADLKTLETWVFQPRHAKSVGMSISTLKRTIKSLIEAKLLEIVGHKEKGIVIYRLNLPGLLTLDERKTDAVKVASAASPVQQAPVSFVRKGERVPDAA